MGDAIVLVVLSSVIYAVIRAMVKNYKKGGHCSGCSGSCSNCSTGCNEKRS